MTGKPSISFSLMIVTVIIQKLLVKRMKSTSPMGTI